MRNAEVPKTPEVNSPKLLQFLDTFEIGHYQKFSFGGTSFNLIIMSPDNPGDPFYSRSTLIDGYDIYIPHIRTENDKRILFHEILECNLKDQGFGNEAHNIAKSEEEKIFDNDKKK